MKAQSVVVILAATNEVDKTVLIWALEKKAVKPGDKVTMLVVLNQITTPMGYKIFVDQRSMLGANKNIIELEAAKWKEMYQDNEELARIAEMYESAKVEFSIQLITGPKEVALETVINLQSTWVIIDRKMKKDVEFFLKNLSCGVSRLKRDNRIEHLRGPPENTPQEYNSRETYNDSTLYEDEDSETNPEKDIFSKYETGQIGGDPKAKEYSSPHEENENDSSLMIDNNHHTSHIVSDQPSQDPQDTEENIHDNYSALNLETNNNQMIGETKDDPLNQDREQQRTSYQDLQNGQKENSVIGSSKCSICSVCKNRRPDIGWQKEFSYGELLAATDGFSIENSLSEGGYGPTFKGYLKGELKIVVKQHQITDPQVEKNIKSEVQLVLKARHKNVAMLLGSCREESHHFIVYEYACNGSLDKYLSEESCKSLTWRQRVKIALGCCRGLQFLHENNIIHGSIKSSNILLTHDFEPLLGDISFGKEKRESKKSFGHKSSGYVAPEFQKNGKLSTKTDVYSIGVVLLELITGRRATDKISGDKILVVWAKQYFGGKKYPQLVDPKISNSYKEDQLLLLVRLTEQCLKKNPRKRLTMNMIVSELQGISNSEDCCVIEESLQEISSSTSSLVDMSGSKGNEETLEPESLSKNKLTNCGQGQAKVYQLSLEERQMPSTPHGDKRSPREMINNHQITGQTNADQPSQVEHQMPSSSHVDEKRSRPMVRNNHVTSEIKEDMLNRDQKQMESSSHQYLLDRYQGEIVVENSKSAVCSICKSRRQNNGWQRDFTYEELQAATGGFSNENSLSDGGYGPAFKGHLEGKLKIVVKQHQISDPQVEKNVKSEVQLLLKARHKNVIMLLGSSSKESQQLMVYEHVCNGSLDKHLSKGSFKPLTWSQRVKVAMGCCRGLKFLHENNIIHGSIKPSNILLTHNFEPLLGDFSFAKAEHALKKTYKDKNSGFMAPELWKSGKFSNKTDVYSFGVVLLELITGKRATDKLSGGRSLVEWAKPLLGGKKYPQLVDPKISSSYEDGQLLSLVKVTEDCLRKNPKKRSSMNMVVSELQGIADDKECYEIEDSPLANPYLTCSVQGINDSQDQTKAYQQSQDEEQKHSRVHGEETIQQPTIITNYMIDQSKADQLSHDEQKHSRVHGEQRIQQPTISTNHMIDQSTFDQLSQDKEQKHGRVHGEERIQQPTISTTYMIDQTKADQQSQDEEQKHSRVHGEERVQQPTISTNHMIDQTKPDQLNQDEAQKHNRVHEEERIQQPVIDTNHMIDQTISDQLSQDEAQKQTGLHGEERIQQPMISSNHMIGKTKAYQLSQDEEQMQKRPHGEERSLIETVRNVLDKTSSQGDEESHYVSGVITSPGDDYVSGVIISSQGNEESHYVSDLISPQGDEESLYVSEATNSRADDESLAPEDLNIKDSEEKEKCFTCGRSTKKTENSQESKDTVICDASATETQEKEGLSTGMSQKSERYTSHGGAIRFFLGGGEKYVVDVEFFSLSSF